MTFRARFAPSPTGSLHVGGARTALYCRLLAQRRGGVFLLRIEDTDQARSTTASAEGLLRDLRWLGLPWNEGPGAEQAGTGPYYQSQRLELYNTVMQQLVEAGAAYEAWDSTEELEAQRKSAMDAKQNFHYRRRTWTDAEVAGFRAEGRVPVLRLEAPHHDLTVDDAILGPVTIVADELDDIIIRKGDGFPTYHFAVVVDDHHMGVSLVLRGQEHLMNTHKHLGLYEALGWTPPVHAHVPLIFNPTGSKMSKRDKAKVAREAAKAAMSAPPGMTAAALAAKVGLPADVVADFVAKKHDRVDVAEQVASALGAELPLIEVMDYRKAGFLPEGLLNYLALLGWSPGNDVEILTLDELVASFELDRVNKTSARFDPVKCRAINAEHIRRASLDRLVEAQASYLEVAPHSPFVGMDADRRRAFLELYQARMETLADLDRAAAFFFEAPSVWDPAAVEKHLRKSGGDALLAPLAEALRGLGSWTAEAIHAALEAFAAERGLGMGKVAQPLRVAITGTSVSPGIGETLALLGPAATLERLAACETAMGSDRP